MWLPLSASQCLGPHTIFDRPLRARRRSRPNHPLQPTPSQHFSLPCSMICRVQRIRVLVRSATATGSRTRLGSRSSEIPLKPTRLSSMKTKRRPESSLQPAWTPKMRMYVSSLCFARCGRRCWWLGCGVFSLAGTVGISFHGMLTRHCRLPI